MEKYLNKIIQGDALEIIEDIPSNSIDLVLTDPPYGDGVAYGRNEKEIANNEDESINYKILPSIYRVLRQNKSCYLFTNWKFYPKIHNFVIEKTGFNIRGLIVIVKNNIGMGYGFRNQHEFCMVLEKGKAKYNNNDFSNIQRMQHIQHDRETHPHEKGIDLISKMILHSSDEGDVVLDPFGGSGTTALACKQFNRSFIVIELDPKWCLLTEDRLKQEILF